jgi:hypothetical protein
VEDDDSVMVPPLSAVQAVEGEEVLAVVRDDRALRSLGVLEQIGVRKASQLGSFVNGDDVVVTAAELLGDHRREHLVEQ